MPRKCRENPKHKEALSLSLLSLFAISVNLVCEIALLPDLTLGTSQRVVLRQDLDGSSKLLEEVSLVLSHLLNNWSGSFVVCELVVHKEQTLVV